jgi:hypothetical protein
MARSSKVRIFIEGVDHGEHNDVSEATMYIQEKWLLGEIDSDDKFKPLSILITRTGKAVTNGKQS